MRTRLSGEAPCTSSEPANGQGEQALEHGAAVGFNLEVEEVIGAGHALIDRQHGFVVPVCVVGEAESRIPGSMGGMRVSGAAR